MNERPTYLMAVSSATQMYSGVGRVLFDWMRFATPHFRFSMLMDMEHAENFEIAAAFCRELSITLHVSATAHRPGAPDTGLGGAARVLGSADWNFIEIVSWASAATALDVLAARPETARLVFTPHTQPLAYPADIRGPSSWWSRCSMLVIRGRRPGVLHVADRARLQLDRTLPAARLLPGYAQWRRPRALPP